MSQKNQHFDSIIEAAKQGDIVSVKNIIRLNHLNINELKANIGKSLSEETLLSHFLTQRENEEMRLKALSTLFEAGVNIKNDPYNLYFACNFAPTVELFETIKQYGGDFTEKYYDHGRRQYCNLVYGMLDLFNVTVKSDAKYKQIKAISYLLDHDIDVNDLTSSGESLLKRAVKIQNKELISFFIDRGAQLDYVNQTEKLIKINSSDPEIKAMLQKFRSTQKALNKINFTSNEDDSISYQKPRLKL